MHIFNSLKRIVRSKDVMPIIGLGRYFVWQFNKLFSYPIKPIRISKSQIISYTRSGSAPLAYWIGLYDYNNMRFLQEILQKEGGAFIDVGANIGTYSLVASEISGVSVFSFEPHPLTVLQLRQNIQSNNRDNVFIIQKAVSEKCGEVFFSDLSESALNHILGTIQRDNGIPIEATTLDSYFQNRNASLTYLKIDVEGFEPQVLLGAIGCLKRLRIVQVENGEREEIKKALRNSGFLGPYYVAYSKKYLVGYRKSDNEDSIYINSNFFEQIKSYGWTFID